MMQGSTHFPARPLPRSPSRPAGPASFRAVNLSPARWAGSAEWSMLPPGPGAAILGGEGTHVAAAEAQRDADWLSPLQPRLRDWDGGTQRGPWGPSPGCLSGMRPRRPRDGAPSPPGVSADPRPRAPSAVSYPARPRRRAPLPARSRPAPAPARLALGAGSLVCFCKSAGRGRGRDDAWEAEGENRGRAPLASDGPSQ